jgi:hypothetical protein
MDAGYLTCCDFGICGGGGGARVLRRRRYNVRRSPSENINLPQALLSRFDLLFLLMDRVNATVDFNLAKHITHVHRFSTAPQVPWRQCGEA